ncbi:MAG: PilN domain-containing protein [Ardenticatenaceae bacterium]|nr:PilN domain-containing protein [Ardenticatenaceae bacterium]
MQKNSPFGLEQPLNFAIGERPVRFRPVLLWLGVLGLFILFIPLYLMAHALGNEVTRLEADMGLRQTALAASPAALQQAQNLVVTLTAVHNQTNQMTALLPTLAAENVDWNAAMAAINKGGSHGVQLTSLEQSGNQLIIRGQAINDAGVTNYAQQLEASGQFIQVTIQSVNQVAAPVQSPTPTVPAPTAVPTALPTSTPRPTAVPTKIPTTPWPTWTPTPKLTDDFEWDDTTAKPIFVGALAQPHNFYPNFDLDQVTFLAKAGRTYEISTDFLAEGVDTFLTVTFGDTTLSNDDAILGVLRSTVTMQAPSNSDVEVLVQISNRGVYGPDKWYDVQVVEIVPATPTPSITPTSGAPTSTPSPTQDLRDSYEPDDTNPKSIAIGDAQIHNFYPDGDVDKVGILVKKGRYYQILTSQLGIGVDTAVTVEFNGETWQNDDYALPGSDNFASSVCFPADENGTAVATINNVGQQFGPSKSYVVSVQEVPFLTVDPEAVDFGNQVSGGGPLTQTMHITGTVPLDWDVTTETPWLSTNVITGTTPATLTLTANLAGLADGLHEGEITLGWAEFCRQTIPVTVQIDPAQSSRPDGNGRTFTVAKVAWLQTGTVEFVIVATLKPMEP